MNTLIIIFSIAGSISLLIIFWKIRLAIQFDQVVKQLFNQSKSKFNQHFHKSQLDHLPEPVQKYFTHLLKEGQPYISFARIKHVGLFKTGMDKSWKKIKGKQYATTEQPGSIWKGTTKMFIARDMYIQNKGRLIVSLFSLFNIVNANGEQYNQGELLRWLGESVLYPTNFLPTERLKWFPIDTRTAKLTYDFNELSLFFKITFNESGEITEMETKRYMDEKSLET